MESGRPGLMLEGLNTEPATANIKLSSEGFD